MRPVQNNRTVAQTGKQIVNGCNTTSKSNTSPTHGRRQVSANALRKLTAPAHLLGPLVVQGRGLVEIERCPVHLRGWLLMLSCRNALFLDAGGLMFGIEHI